MQVLADLWQFLLSVIETLGLFFQANPDLLWGLSALLLIIIILLLIPHVLKAIPKSEAPEIVLSRGELHVFEDEEKLIYQVQFNVSNLSQEPIQLLELAISSKQLDHPLSIDCIHLLPTRHSLDIQESIAVSGTDVGDTGHLSLFFYTRSRKAFQLRAPFVWEPWAQSYKLDPLQHQIRTTKKLASKESRTKLMQAWREQEKQSTPKTVVERPQDPGHEDADLGTMSFPDDFD